MSKHQTLDDEFIKETVKVRCEICGREFEQITCSHLKMHGTNMCEYREQFPDAPLISESSRKKISDAKLGKPFTEEHKQKIREVNLGKHLTEATKQKISEATSGENNPMYGKRGEETGMFGRSGEKAPMFGVEAWNKGKTKETDGRVKKSGEKLSKTKNEFFVTEEGQKWIDEHLRDENNPMHGRTGEDASYYKGGYEKARARREEKRRGFGFVPLNDNFIGAEAHHIDKELVLYVPKELHRSVHHNMFTGQGMEEINNLACEYVYGIDTKDQCFIPKEEKIPKI